MGSNFTLDWARRTKLAEPFVSVLTFPKGYIGTIPSVRASKRGGWIYHPLEGTEKKPVTLGRADDGRAKAANLVEFLIQQTYETNNWDIPINAMPPVTEHDANNARGGGRDGASVLFAVKNYGFMKLGVSQERSTWNTTNKSWDFDIVLPTVIITALGKQIVSLNDPAMTIRVPIPNIDDIQAVSDLFIDDPLLGFAKAMELYGDPSGKVQTFNRQITLSEIPVTDIVKVLERLEPIHGFVDGRWAEAADSWSSSEFYSKNPDGTQGPKEAEYQVAKSFLMASPKYRTVQVTQSFVDSAEILKQAFEALGVEVEVLTSTGADLKGDYQTVVDGIKVTVPAGMGGDTQNREGHAFTLTSRGATITCGYVANEEQYIDDASRQALSDMQSLLEG